MGYLTEQVERIHKIVAALQPQTTTDKHRIVDIDETCIILHIKAKELLDGATPTSTPTSLIPANENIKRLIEVIGENQLSVKEMLVAVGLKDRPNFLEYSLSPAMNEGYVRMLYPDSPRHPRQKYLLTVKGLAAYKEIKA